MNYDDFPPLLTVAETQKLLRIGRGKTYEMIRAREIPAFKLRGAIRIPRDELLHMLERQGREQQEISGAKAKLRPVPLARRGGE